MCGIAGLISSRREPTDIVRRMNALQGHRGPDGNGIYCDKNIGLGHVRLSILDLSQAGAQPMEYTHLVVVFNGEIYNFLELRQELEAQGYNFSSDSDTEVLLKAWHCWGENCLQKLNGMFAFAILDKNSQKLTISRDAYGVKPVFYSTTNDELVFGSELNTVIDALETKPQISSDAVSTYLAIQFIPAPETGWEGIYKIMPGTSLVFSIAGPRPKLINTVEWGHSFLPKKSKSTTDIDQIEKALENAVHRQMISDVPVGAFLSGGVDSSLICHFASKKSQIHTFSIGYSDAGEEHDETRFAEIAAKTINSIHHPIQIELASINERIDSTLELCDELNADTSIFLNDVICEHARKHVTVCLSGAGGDELFAGYYRHQAMIAQSYLNMIPMSLVNLAQKVIAKFPQHRDSSAGNFARRLDYFLQQRTTQGNFVNMLRCDNQFVQESRFLSENHVTDINSALAFDFRHFLGDNIFGFTDKISMKHSLEVRVPFLDPDVIELAESIPTKENISLFQKKIMLKKIAARHFPRSIIYRKKQGFSAPLDIWMRSLSVESLKKMCCEGISSTLVNESLIHDLANKFINEKADLSTQLYSFIVLNKWHSNSNSTIQTNAS